MNTTLFDLNQSAATAAVTALGKDALATESLKLEAFTASAFDRADFSQWQAYFTNHVANYTSLQAQPSPATKAANIAAAAATAKANAAAKVATDAANKTAAAAQVPAAAAS